MHCPLEKGKLEIVKDIALPKEIPPVRTSRPGIVLDRLRLMTMQGRYTVTADVLTKDDEKITCLEAAITFDIRR